jgi:hypothetical protein
MQSLPTKTVFDCHYSASCATETVSTVVIEVRSSEEASSKNFYIICYGLLGGRFAGGSCASHSYTATPDVQEASKLREGEPKIIEEAQLKNE